MHQVFNRGIAVCAVAMLLGTAISVLRVNAEGEKPSSAQGPIKIGYLVPMSGTGASGGSAMVNGMKLYLDQINNTMAGRKVELIVENDESYPATAVAKLHKLIDVDKAQVVAGTYLANVLYGLAPVIEKLQIPYVDVVSGADDITQRQRGKWLIRISWTSSQLTHPLGDWVYHKLGYKKVATIGADYAYGYEVVGGFQKSFEAAGGQVIQKLWAPMGFQDFKSLLKQIRPDADAVFMVAVGPQSQFISEQYKELGLKQPIIGAGGTQFDEIASLPKFGKSLIGGVHADPYTLEIDTAANKAFVKAFKDKYGTAPGFFAECGYDAGMWIHKAVDSLHGNVDDKAKLLAALKAVQLPNAPRGPMKLDEYGNIVDNIYVTKVVERDGKFQNTLIETFPMVSQFWKWTPEEYLKQPLYSKDYPPCKHCAN
jgi:branched-chain amino acid transport system substrate-binding protein